jgi:microcystin degradation protein MlrC
VQACCAPPMAIGIERQATAEPPCRDLMAAAAAAVRRDRILAASVVLGFPYADVAEMGSAVVVVADGDRAAAEQAAHELGRAMWDTRSELVGRFLSPEEAVAAAARADGTTCLLDMGDNVGGGSTGDGMALVGELMRQRVGPALAVIWDPTAAAAARAAGPGATVHLAVGGKSDPRYGPPLVAPFEVLARTDGRFAETEPRHGGRTAYDQGSTAVVRHGDVTLMLTTNRMPPFSLQQILHAGLTPRAFRVLVAKGVHAPVAAYAPVCERLIRVDTPGITAADMTRFELGRRRRPMFPFEPHAPFSPALGSGARD